MYGVQNRCNGPNTIEWGFKECFVMFTFNLFNCYTTVLRHTNYISMSEIQLMRQKKFSDQLGRNNDVYHQEGNANICNFS